MFIAEREGFEPPVPLSTTVFKTVVIDHSTISPLSRRQALCSKASAKVMSFSYSSKFFQRKFINIRYFSIKRQSQLASATLRKIFEKRFGWGEKI